MFEPPPGERVLTCSQQEIKLWSHIQRYSRDPQPITISGELDPKHAAILWSRSEHPLLACGTRGFVLIFRLGNPTPQRQLERLPQHYNSVGALEFGHDKLVVSNFRNFDLYDVSTMQRTRSTRPPHDDAAITCVSLAKQSPNLLATGSSNVVKIWDTRKELPVGAFSQHETAWVIGAEFVPNTNDNSIVVAQGGCVGEWDMRSLTKVPVEKGHHPNMTSLAVSPSGCHVMTQRSFARPELAEIKLWRTPSIRKNRKAFELTMLEMAQRNEIEALPRGLVDKIFAFCPARRVHD
eukprot:c18333_g1_i1.p1 GENE.c18333_g1_i1~~c18333_g1_i1.p1  ORF type:complete len:340 (-),score=53.68 c18333_g1_i1:65-943(-)